MCVGPSVPEVAAPAQRQAEKAPDSGSTAGRADQNAKRRRALMATILTSSTGALGSPGTTNTLGA